MKILHLAQAVWRVCYRKDEIGLQCFYILLLNHYCQKWCAELQDLWADQDSRVMLSVIHNSSGWKNQTLLLSTDENQNYICAVAFYITGVFGWREQQCCSGLPDSFEPYLSFSFGGVRLLQCLSLKPRGLWTQLQFRFPGSPGLGKASVQSSVLPSVLDPVSCGKLHYLHLAACTMWQLLPPLQLLCLCRNGATPAQSFLPVMEMRKWPFSTEPLSVVRQCCSELAAMGCALSFPKHSSRLQCSDTQDRAADFPGSSEMCRGMCFHGPASEQMGCCFSY